MGTDDKTKKNLFLLLAIIIIVLVGGVFYLFKAGFLGNDKILQESDSLDEAEFSLDMGILNTPFFKNLKRYGVFPIKERESGRENPFEPYK